MLPATQSDENKRAIAFVLGVQDNYRFQIRSWIKWMEEEGHVINQEGVAGYFTWLNAGSPYAARTIANKRAAVKKRIRAMYRDRPYEERAKMNQFLKDLDEDHATAAPRPANDAIGRDKVVPMEMYEAMKTASITARQRLFFRFLVSTGTRVTEAVTARLVDCVADGPDWIKITVKGKGSKGVAYKTREVSIERSLYDEIRQEFAGTTYLFETSTGRPVDRNYVSRTVKKVGKRIGINISAHTLRHSFATNYLTQNPGKVAALSSFLGHSSVSITLSYYVHEEVTKDQLRRVSA